MAYYDLLETCVNTGKERGGSYGPIEENFVRWKDILKAMFNIELTEIQLCEVLIAMKYSRELNSHKEDNTIDIINYTAIREELIRIKNS